RSTWASPVVDYFARPTTAPPGRRLPMAKFHSARPDPLPSRIPIQTSFISEPAPTVCAATSQPDAACTNQPTAARRGSLSVLQRRTDRRRPHSSDESRHRLGRSQRQHLQIKRRARRVQNNGRRTDVAQSFVPVRRRRRDGCRVATRRSERGVRVDVTTRTQTVDDNQRISRRWFLQEY